MMFQLGTMVALCSAAAAGAQITNPDNLIAPPPPPIQFHGKHLVRVHDFQWLWQYTQPTPNGNEAGLLADPHFAELLDDNLKAPQSFFRNGAMPLADVARRYFGMTYSAVRGIDNRYVTFASCVPHDCTRQGLIWVDTMPQHPTVVFAATEWTTEGEPESDPGATYNLWIFSSRPLPADDPPASLVAAIQGWNSARPQHIQTALLIDPDGTPHKVNPAVFGATPAEATK